VLFRSTLKTVTRRLALVILFIAGLAAFQLIPFVDLLLSSDRSSGYGRGDWAMSGTGWANFLVPLFHCYRWQSGVYFQISQWFVSSYYLGIIVLNLALVGLAAVRVARVRVLGAIAFLGLVLALGDQGHVYAWIRTVFPAIGFMRFPIKFLFLTTFAVPLLAGYGIRAFYELQLQRWSLAAWIGVIFTVLIAAITTFDYYHPLPWELWQETCRNGISRILILFAGLVVIRFLFSPRIGRGVAGYIGIGLIVLLWLDIKTHVPDQNPTVPRNVYRVDAADTSLLKPRPGLGLGRLIISPEARERMHRTFSANHAEDYLASRLGYFANCNLIDRIPKVDGFYAMQLQGIDDIISTIYGDHPKIPVPFADFVGACQITEPHSTFTWQARTNFMPMIYSGQEVVFIDGIKARDLVLSDEFNPRKTVVLPTSARALICVSNGVSADISSVNVGEQELEFRAEAPANVMVTVAQAYHHNWQVWIDGRPGTVLRANHAFQAFELPAGSHKVRMAYVDKGFIAGTLISVGTLIVMIFAWRRSAKRMAAG
jgi:hypothetical protein